MVENFRIRSGRQKSAEATADNLAYTGRLRYTGIPGLDLSASIQYQTDIAQNTLLDDASAVLTQAHLIYQNNDFSLRALYANWNIDNAEFEASGSDQPSGWFIEPSYRLTDKLGIFARYSEVDPARGDRPTEITKRVDYGFNYWLHPQVAIKADYQNSIEDGSDAVNIGIGWSY
jgi:predicted porin